MLRLVRCSHTLTYKITRSHNRVAAVLAAMMGNRGLVVFIFFFFSSRRRHTRWTGDWSSDVCSSDLGAKFRNSGPGAYASPFPMSNALGAHSTRPWARAAASESVQAGAVVPEDPSLVLLGERELEEMRGGLGILRVVVRIVGRENEAGAGAAVHGVSRRLLVAFDGDEALADEVLARPLCDRWILEAPRILPVLVETPEPEGQPGPVAFEEGHLQSWEAGQHPAERHRLHGQHLLHAVRARVLECERVVAEAIRPHRGHGRGHGLVEAERHAEVLDRRPERIEDRPVPVDSGARRVRSEKDRLEAQLRHRAARLADRQGDVLDREHGRSVHPPGIAGLAEVGQPVVVGPRDRGRERRVHVRVAVHEEAPRGVEHGHVDPFAIHRTKLRRGVEAALDVLGKPVQPARERHAGDPSRQEELVRAVDGHADVRGLALSPARRPVPERGIDVALPQVDRLQHVHVAVEDLEPVFHAGSSFVQATGFSSVPIPSISTFTTSPGWRKTPRPNPTPDGVPVESTSPGSSVIVCERNASRSPMLWVRSSVRASCMTWSFTVVLRLRRSGSSMNASGTRYGPMGQNVSAHLPMSQSILKSRRLGTTNERAVTSFTIV